MLRKLTFFCEIGTHSVDFKIELHICCICLGIWVFKSELALPEQQFLCSLYWTPLLWGWPAHLVLVWTVVTPRGSFTSLLFQVSGASWPSCAFSFMFPAHASSSPLCHLPSIPAKYISAPQGLCNWHYGKGKWFSNCCLFSEVLRTPVCVYVCVCVNALLQRYWRYRKQVQVELLRWYWRGPGPSLLSVGTEATCLRIPLVTQ